MTHTPATRETFEVVRRGYDPQQVDRRLAALARDLQESEARRADLEGRVEQLHLQAQTPGEQAAPYAGLGARVEQMLELAGQEADELRAAAQEEAAQHRALTEQDAARIR